MQTRDIEVLLLQPALIGHYVRKRCGVEGGPDWGRAGVVSGRMGLHTQATSRPGLVASVFCERGFGAGPLASRVVSFVFSW